MVSSEDEVREESKTEGEGAIASGDPGVKREKIEGIVKWFHYRKGFGFLERNDGEPDVFVHRSGIRKPNHFDMWASLDEGEPVEFTLGQFQGAVEAVNVTGPNGRKVVGSRYATPFYSNGYYFDGYYYDPNYYQYQPAQQFRGDKKSKKNGGAKEKVAEKSHTEAEGGETKEDQISKERPKVREARAVQRHSSYDLHHGYPGLIQPAPLEKRKRRRNPMNRRKFVADYYDHQYQQYYYPPHEYKGHRKPTAKSTQSGKGDDDVPSDHQAKKPSGAEVQPEGDAQVAKEPSKRRRSNKRQSKRKVSAAEKQELAEGQSEEEPSGQGNKLPPQRRRYRRRREQKSEKIPGEQQQKEPTANGHTTDSGVSSPQPPGEVDRAIKVVSAEVTIQLNEVS